MGKVLFGCEIFPDHRISHGSFASAAGQSLEMQPWCWSSIQVLLSARVGAGQCLARQRGASPVPGLVRRVCSALDGAEN